MHSEHQVMLSWFLWPFLFHEAKNTEKDRLIELRDTQREDFSNHRDYERVIRTVSANIDMILGKSHEQEQQIEKEQNL